MEIINLENWNKIKENAIVIFGAGRRGRFIAEMLCDMGSEIICFLDNDRLKQGTFIGGIRVISPEQLLDFARNFCVVLSYRNQEIEKQLSELGILYECVYDMSEYGPGKVPSYFEISPKKEHRFLTKEIVNTPVASISKMFFCDNVFYMRGWYIPSNLISRITVRLNKGEELVVLREEREDIVKLYPYHYTETCGFYFAGEIERQNKVNVDIFFWSGDEVVYKLEMECRNTTFCELWDDFFQTNGYPNGMRILQGRKDNLWLIWKELINLLKANRKHLKRNIDRIWSCQIQYYFDEFDKSDMAMYLELIDEVEDYVAQTWLCEQDIPWMIFLYPQLITEDLYVKRRDLLLKLAPKCFSTSRIKARVDNNIVILVETLSAGELASTIFELSIVKELQRRNYNVLVVVTDASYSSDIMLPGLMRHNRNSEKYNNEHKQILEELQIHYCKAGTYMERLREAYRIIEEFSPGVIVDISLGGTIISAGLCNNHYHVIHIPLTGYSSSAVFNRYIAKDKNKCIEENKMYNSIREEDIFEAPIKIPYSMQSNKFYNRQSYNIKKEDFVLVTVGNRLQYELDDLFLLEMSKLLNDNEEVKWLVVGLNLGSKFERFKRSVNNTQVIEWGYENDLVALYRICDVYVNPNRMGGCGSIEMAMELGLPIALTKYYADISPIIGVQNCAEDYSDMFKRILELKESAELRVEQGSKMKRLVNRKELSMEHYTDVILSAYEDIVKSETGDYL